LPTPQSVVRCPPINWAQYGVVGDSLEKLHAEQMAAPTPGVPLPLGPGGSYEFISGTSTLTAAAATPTSHAPGGGDYHFRSAALQQQQQQYQQPIITSTFSSISSGGEVDPQSSLSANVGGTVANTTATPTATSAARSTAAPIVTPITAMAALTANGMDQQRSLVGVAAPYSPFRDRLGQPPGPAGGGGGRGPGSRRKTGGGRGRSKPA